MSEIKIDKYNLNYSPQFKISDVEEVAQDLELEVSAPITSSVLGKVLDKDGLAASGVTVKLFDKDGAPFKHTVTDENGAYVFTGLKSENYSVSTVKKAQY